MPTQNAPIQRAALVLTRGPLGPNAWGFGVAAIVATLSTAIVLCGCGPQTGPIGAASTSGGQASESAYRPPPSVLAAQHTANGVVVLVGRADAGDRVRLAASTGARTPAVTDGRGGWRARLAPAGEVRLFGLAAFGQGRTVQAQGYLAVTPDGLVAQLRAGAGAEVLRPGPPLRILAVDYDRKGGAVVSGADRPGATVALSADGLQRGRIAVNHDGRFAMALDEPLAPGPHRIEADDGGARAAVSLSVTPAAPLTGGPFRAGREAGGWRIDWLTPGGGGQTTFLFASKEGPA